MNNNDFFIIVYPLIIAFFGAICKEINDKTHDNTESFSIFFGEIMLHGFSGWIVGLYSIKYYSSDLISITMFAGLGGLFGFELVKKIYTRVFPNNGKSSKNKNKKTKDEEESDDE